MNNREIAEKIAFVCGIPKDGLYNAKVKMIEAILNDECPEEP